MPNQGRKKTEGGLVRWALLVPTDLAARIELKLLDPIYNQPRYGERSKLVNALLDKWDRGEINIPL